MRKIFSKSKLKAADKEAAASSGASSSSPGYQLKEKDLPKVHKAAWIGDLAKIQQLSKKNDVYALDKQNRTPLHLACAKGHTNILQFLTANPPSGKLNLCDNDQRSALMKAVQSDFDECTEILLNAKADPNLVDRDGNTALHLAADLGYVHVAILLLNNGAMATPANKTGSTPLHMGVAGKHDEMVEILLEGNADVNAADNENRTVLMLACQADQIGMVKMLLDNKADTDIKDSKGWTANDHAIMGGFHGCSHLIDEFNASRRPKAPSSRPSSAGLFGSTTGSDALGFSLGGPAADNFDDEEDDMSFGKGSVVDSWNASASEAEEIPKPKPKMNKPVKLSKFVQESDNESIRSGVSMRSTASKSRIPKSVSRQPSITSERSLQSARGTTSGSRLPRPASATSVGSHKGAGAAMPSRHEQRRGSRGSRTSQRKDSWDDSAPPTPAGSVPVTPRDSRGVTPRDGFLPTPRGSILSAVDTGSEWDDDDVLDALEDTGTRQQMKVPEQRSSNVETAKPMDKEKQSGNHQRKAVLEGLGMSDVDDESSVAFSDDENLDGTLKRNVKASGDSTNMNENNHKDQMPPPEDEEEDDSEWDSDGDDLLPSETETKGPSLIRPGVLSRGEESESDINFSVTPSPVPPHQVEETHTHRVDRTPVKKPEIKVDSPRDHEKAVADDDEDDWDSEDEDPEEESEWEKGKGDKRESLGEELESSGHYDELDSRQKDWEEESKRKEQKLRQEAEEELRREKEEQERERQQREEEKRQLEEERKQQEAERQQREEEKRLLEEERKQQEEERQQLEKERAAERRRQEEQAAKDQRRREEGEAEVARKKAEVEAEVARKKAEIEAERQHLEETRRQEEEKLKADRELLEEQRRVEQEKRDAEQRQLEEERKREEKRLEEERKKLEEEKRRTNEERDEETRKREQALKEEERRIEAEKQRLEELKQQEQKKLEEAKRLEDLKRKKEHGNQEEERKRLEEERRQMEEHRRRIEEEKKQLEEERKFEQERKQMEDDRRKREEERLEAERKRQEELRRQFQEDQLKMTQELKDEDDIRRAMERKHIEDERQRLEEERLEAEKREREREEQRMEEKRQLLATQREMEEMRRKMEEEKITFEQQMRENSEKNAEGAQREKFEETLRQEQEKMKQERERLEAENRDIEKKRKEIESMQKEFENKNQERTLLRYQQSIEKRLEDEDRSHPSANGVDEDNDSLADVSRDLEAAVVQRRQIESATYVANPGPRTPGSKLGNTASEVQSLANTADFSAASLSHQGNPLPSMRGASKQSPAVRTSPTKPLYNSPMLRSSMNHTSNSVPTWQTILAEPDGLDYTSSEDEADLLVAQEGFLSSLRSPQHLAASTPVQGLYTTPGSPLSPNDPTTVIRLQSMVRDQKRATERERNERLNANNQCKILHGEKTELQRRLDEVMKFKMSLDQQLLDLEAKIRGLEHELSQEVERRHNSEVLLQKTKEQLKRKEELYAAEIDAKQKTELASRSVQMDLRSTHNIVKQLEDERNELKRQLNQEKTARAIQEDMIGEHRRAQETMQEESTRIVTEKAEAVNRLEAADESRKAAMNQTDKLKTELHALKMQLEKQKMRHRDDQGLLVSENEELTGKIEELKNEMRVAEEALAHATMTYNAQLAAVRTENAVLHNGMEKEKNAKEQFKAQFESVQKRLESTSKDLEKAEKARTELEHDLRRGKDEWTRTREQIQHENTTMKDSSQGVAQRLGAAETRVASLENELQAANNALMEKNNQLMTIQRDLDLKSSMQNSHDTMLQKEREEKVKLSARMETMTERLSESQTEIGSLKRQLDAAQHHNAFKDKDAQTAQDKFNNTLTSLQAENDRTRSIWDERNNALQESISRLKEELQRSEHNSSLKDQDLRKLQQELTESLLKVSITENTLEMSKKMKDDLEKEKTSSKDDVKQLTDKLSAMERECHRLESRVDELQNQLVHAERSNLDTSHQLMTTQTTLQHKSDLELTIRQLEKENSRLEMGLKQESTKAEDLSRKLDESQKMVNGLESMITNIKTSQLVMEDKLSEATAAKSMFEREVVDHKQLWETEVKSRSKLGLRIAQLERAKTETQVLVEEEKKKTRKMAELKRSAEEKLQNEIQRSQQYEQDIATLRAKIKLAKKKLKDQGPPELRLSTMQTEFERERLNMESAVGTLRRQLEDVNQQLDRESMMRLNMEKANRQLQQDVSTSRTSEKTKEKLERQKRKLEEQLGDMKRALENGYVEKGHLEKYKQEIDAKARLEINEKLEQVNAYLEEQSQAREKLEQLRIANEAEVRKELEATINELKHQLSRSRNGYHDSQTQKDTLAAETSKFKELYNQELQRREKLSADLEKTQDKLLEAQSKLNFERQRNRHMQAGHHIPETNGISPIKATDPPGESIVEKVWSELDRSISRHLQAGPSDLGPNIADFQSERLNNSYGASSPRGQDNSYLATLRKNYFV